MTDRVIRVILDPSGVESGARRAGQPLSRIERRTQGINRALKTAARLASGFVAALGARELVRTADVYNQIQNRLRIVTDSTEELVTANERLFDIAQDTRQPLEATVELFTRASIAANELGASEEELFRLTEITGQALAIQGGAASEASGALRQLSQSFASGIVRAEEFNSILEGAFPLAQAAARGIDEAAGSVGKLRNLVVEGEITSREFFEAILEGGEELGTAFGQTIPTVGQSLTTLSNSFISFIGQLDESIGVTDVLASSFLGLSSGIDNFGSAITGSLDETDELSAGMETLAVTAIVAGQALSSIFNLLKIGKKAFVDIGESLGAYAASLAQLGQGNFQAAADIFSEAGFDDTQKAFTDFFEGFDKGIESVSERISQVLLPSFRDLKDATDDVTETAGTIPPIIPPNTADQVVDATAAVQDFLVALENQEAELLLTSQEGDNAADAIRRYREDLALAGAEAEIFGTLQPTEEVEALRQAFREFATESIASQRELRDEIEAADLAETFDEQIAALEEEIRLLGADTEALAANAEARALAGGATEIQAEKIGELTEILANEQEALRRETAVLEGFFEEVGASAQRTLSGFLADPLSEGLDELPFKFAQTLQQLAADALASEIFSILGGLAGGAGGGGAGAAAGLVGAFFGGGFQAGGQVSGGRPILVGERGPELFTPAGSGSVSPNVNINQAAQSAPTVVVNNITDPADIPSGLRTAEGEEEVINIIQRNPDAVRRILG
jgi:tape measure domain-containing protein